MEHCFSPWRQVKPHLGCDISNTGLHRTETLKGKAGEKDFSGRRQEDRRHLLGDYAVGSSRRWEQRWNIERQWWKVLYLFPRAVTTNYPILGGFSSVQFSRSVVSDSLRPHESQHARPPCPSPTPGVHSDSTSIESVMPSSHLILSHPLLLLPPIPPSIRVFSNESTLRRRWPKYWSFSFSIIPSKEIPGLISFRMDWLNLLA